MHPQQNIFKKMDKKPLIVQLKNRLHPWSPSSDQQLLFLSVLLCCVWGLLLYSEANANILEAWETENVLS